MGEGSTFWFEVPLRRVQGVSSGSVAKTEPYKWPVDDAETSTSEHGLNVLVVEDIRINQMVAERALKHYGHSVVTASNGEQAIEALMHHSFDAIIMDVRMPVLNGLETTSIIRESGKSFANIPIIGLTADVTPEQLQACRDAGMNEVMTKPFHREHLNTLLDRLTC